MLFRGLLVWVLENFFEGGLRVFCLVFGLGFGFWLGFLAGFSVRFYVV